MYLTAEGWLTLYAILLALTLGSLAWAWFHRMADRLAQRMFPYPPPVGEPLNFPPPKA